jgi:hypothetical protein
VHCVLAQTRDTLPGRTTALGAASDVAELLKVELTRLYDEVPADRFPVVRLGRQLRFRQSAGWAIAWAVTASRTAPAERHGPGEVTGSNPVSPTVSGPFS